MRETQQMVMVRGLRKSYGGRAVVDGLDLDVGPGQIVGLIGANGAGKTTAVECVQGLRKPDAGRIQVLGLDPATQGERLRKLVGSQLQSSALPDRLRVGEAVWLFSGRKGLDLLERFGLANKERSAFASLSGGERQRLFLVLALVNTPRLVVLDELTTGLDPAASRNVWAAVEQLRSDGTSVLLVTHQLDEAERLCDEVVAMRAGRGLDRGTPRELVDRYGSRATVSFSLPGEPEAASACERLGRLPGVSGAARTGVRITVSGDRSAIAYVGADLVATGQIPDDLSVKIPTLEDALVELLERPDQPLPDNSDSSYKTNKFELTGANLWTPNSPA
jgi:ABC-2 type transport system ATP-binding protein